MKKIILSFMLLMLAHTFVHAQCVPGAVTLPLSGYIIPDSATNFATGCAGLPYEQIIYIKAPTDTTVGPAAADVDSFVVNTNITGLPAYLTVQTVPGISPANPGDPKTNFPHLTIPGGSLACIRISGNIPAGTSGNNPLTIFVRAYLKLGGIIPLDTTANVTYYHINVMNPCWPAAVNDVHTGSFKILQAIPNPTSGYTQVAFSANTAAAYQYKLTNSLGEVVLSRSIKGDAGMNYISVDASHLSRGIYLFSLSDGKDLLSQKIVVNK